MAVDAYDERVNDVVEKLASFRSGGIPTKELDNEIEQFCVGLLEQRLGGKAWKDFLNDVKKRLVSKFKAEKEAKKSEE